MKFSCRGCQNETTRETPWGMACAYCGEELSQEEENRLNGIAKVTTVSASEIIDKLGGKK